MNVCMYVCMNVCMYVCMYALTDLPHRLSCLPASLPILQFPVCTSVLVSHFQPPEIPTQWPTPCATTLRLSVVVLLFIYLLYSHQSFIHCSSTRYVLHSTRRGQAVSISRGLSQECGRSHYVLHNTRRGQAMSISRGL
jgi:hypothetical protein